MSRILFNAVSGFPENEMFVFKTLKPLFMKCTCILM